MRSRAVLGVVIVLAAVVAVAVPGLALGQPDPDASQTQPTTAANSTTTETTIAVHLRPNGDARVRAATTFTLDDTNDTAAFRALGREFEDGERGFSPGPFRQAANESSTVTGRSMNVTNVTRNTTVVGENTSGADTGRLVLGFTWTNFARTDGDRVVVGDAFNTTHGTWLPGLTANQILLIEAPPRYDVVQSPVGFTNDTLGWEGPTRFEPGEPVAAFERRTGGQPNGTSDNGGSGLLESTPLFALGMGVLLFGVVVGAYALLRREGTDEPAGGQAGATPPAESTDGASPADADGTTDATDASDGSGGPVVEEELLSDEERVERLLARNDGRMKQASIVEATGWSNAKVSQLLSAMDEAGRIDKLRIGRENLISLPDGADDEGK